MDIKISSIVKANESEWDSIWQSCDYSTYFHSREWAEIWNKYTDGKIQPKPLIIHFSDGAKALLPLSYQRILKGLISQYISSPAGTFGGWISNGKLTIEHGRLLIDYMCTKIGSLVWRLNPYDKIVSQLRYPNLINDETHVLNLEKGFNYIYHNWTKGHKSAVHKASNAHIVIQATDKKEHWEEYYVIYEDSLQRWGEKATSLYKWQLFEIIYNMDSKNIKLWVAKYEDKIIAGALCFYSKNHVVYWHGAALSAYFNMRPVNFLIYEIVKDTCDHGYRWFDFNPSGGLEGVKAFKKSFGAEVLPSGLIITKSKIYNTLETLKKYWFTWHK
jgi:hypothetical protein